MKPPACRIDVHFEGPLFADLHVEIRIGAHRRGDDLDRLLHLQMREGLGRRHALRRRPGGALATDGHSWTRNGLWQAVLGALSSAARDDDGLLIDSTAVRVHAHGAGPAGGQLAQAMGRSKASLSTKIHLACDALGYPLGFILTGANVSDVDQAKPLRRVHLGPGSYVIIDKGYDSDAIRAYVNQLGGVAVKFDATFAAMVSLAFILVWLKLRASFTKELLGRIFKIEK